MNGIITKLGKDHIIITATRDIVRTEAVLGIAFDRSVVVQQVNFEVFPYRGIFGSGHRSPVNKSSALVPRTNTITVKLRAAELHKAWVCHIVKQRICNAIKGDIVAKDQISVRIAINYVRTRAANQHILVCVTKDCVRAALGIVGDRHMANDIVQQLNPAKVSQHDVVLRTGCNTVIAKATQNKVIAKRSGYQIIAALLRIRCADHIQCCQINSAWGCPLRGKRRTGIDIVKDNFAIISQHDVFLIMRTCQAANVIAV